MVKKLRYVFDRKDKIKLVGLAILMVIGSVLELLAVAVFNPFIEVLMQTSSIEDDSFLKLFFTHIHLNGIEQYLVVLSALIAVIYLVKNIYLSFLQNVILSFSSDRLSGDIYMVKLKGSTVVEMAYLMPVVLLCWMAVIFALFYYHDKNIIGGAAYETAIVGSEEWRWKKEIEDGKMEQYFQKRIENKLIFFDTVSVETAVVKDEFEVTAGAQKRKMRVSVKRSAALTVPEEKIRRKKVLQEIVERDQEE